MKKAKPNGKLPALREAVKALAAAVPALDELVADREGIIAQEERLPAGWEAPVFDDLHGKLAKRYRSLVGRDYEDPLAPDPAELAAMARRLCSTFGVECGAAVRRPSPQIWADDPGHFTPISEHVGAYLGAGYDHAPVRMALRPDVARRVRPDGSLKS